MLKSPLRRTSIAVAVTATMLSVSAIAEDNRNLADVPFKTTHAYLTAEGYTSIVKINENPNRLSAYDLQGSEVRLKIQPKTGKITSSRYIHLMDK